MIIDVSQTASGAALAYFAQRSSRSCSSSSSKEADLRLGEKIDAGETARQPIARELIELVASKPDRAAERRPVAMPVEPPDRDDAGEHMRDEGFRLARADCSTAGEAD